MAHTAAEKHTTWNTPVDPIADTAAPMRRSPVGCPHSLTKRRSRDYGLNTRNYDYSHGDRLSIGMSLAHYVR